MFDIRNCNSLVELHSHLDGALSIDSVRNLAALQNIGVPSNDDELRAMLQVSPGCKDLNEFLEKFDFPNTLLQTKIGISHAVFNLLEELKSDGHIYAEIRFAPQFSTQKGLSQKEVVEAAIDGLKRSGLRANLILCCMRGTDNHSQNLETVRIAKKFLGRGVCAIDLAGAEALFPTQDYKEEFELAHELGIPFTIHAGEADGPHSVMTALEFGALRIGHGVRSIEDSQVVEELSKRGVLLELCPTSNLCTCIFDSISEYPLKTLRDAGVKVSINTDDSSVCGTNLTKEWQLLIDEFNLDSTDVKAILLDSVDSSFASEETKLELRSIIEADFS